MIKLLKNANVYAPAPLGQKDVLIIGDKIARIADKIEGYEGLPEVEVFDLEDQLLVPGYIDLHVHITGGGGEQGPASRVPEAPLSVLLKNGITTVVGLLGTDGITRSIENLVAKARALTEEGITAYALTGAYAYPSPTMTGSVEKDIVMIDPIIGVKVAVADHRSSNPTSKELIDLGTQARRAGLLGNTPGLVIMHMGDGSANLQHLFAALDNSDIPARNFLPTHMLRTPELIAAGKELIKRGGYMDCTPGGDDATISARAEKLYQLLISPDVSADQVSISSDAFGSQPRFNEKKECIGLTYASPDSLHKTIRLLVDKGLALETALKLVTTTPAHVLNKDGIKGCIAAGADADLLVLDSDLTQDSLFAKGQTAIWHKEILMKGRFEL